MGAGADVLKRGGWHFSYLIFSKFIIFICRNYFTPLHLKKDYFFLPP